MNRKTTLMVLAGGLAGAATVLITAACVPPADTAPTGGALVAPLTTSEVIQEDDPRWDCRLMGNRECGVQVQGAWYVITFDEAGAPLTVRTR